MANGDNFFDICESPYTIIFHREFENKIATVIGNLQPSFQINLSSSYSAPFNFDLNGTLLSGFQILTGIMPKHKAQTAQIWQGSEVPSFTVTINLETESDVSNDIRDQILKLMSFVSPTESGQSQMIRAPQRLNYDKFVSRFSDEKSLSKEIKAQYEVEEESRKKQLSSKSDGTPSTTAKMENGQQAPNSSTSSDTSKTQGIADEIASMVEGAVHIRIGKYLDFPYCVVTDVNFNVNSIMDYATGYPQSAEVQVTFKPLMLPLLEDWEKMLMQVETISSKQNLVQNQNNGLVGQIVGTATNAINSVSNSISSTIAKGADRVNSWTDSLFN